jgi:hypothetical protein
MKNETKRWFIKAWDAGGCGVCSGPTRDDQPFAHTSCYRGLSEADKKSFLTEMYQQRCVGRATSFAIAPLESDLASARAEIERLKLLYTPRACPLHPVEEIDGKRYETCACGWMNPEHETRCGNAAHNGNLAERVKKLRREVSDGDSLWGANRELRNTLDRSFRFLASMSPHFNQPALSAQGKREREEYRQLCADMKAALRLGKSDV